MEWPDGDTPTPVEMIGIPQLMHWPVRAAERETTMSDEPTTLQKVEATVWGATKAMAASKKFQAAMLSGVLWGLGKLGLKMDASDLVPIVAPLWLYVFGQGLADFGKSAAQAGGK